MSRWFLAIYVPKSDKLLLIIQKASISNYGSHAIKYSCPKKLVLKSFSDTILQSRSLCSARYWETTMQVKIPEQCSVRENWFSFISSARRLRFHLQHDKDQKVVFLKKRKKKIKKGEVTLFVFSVKWLCYNYFVLFLCHHQRFLSKMFLLLIRVQ